jgi:hypothetical protein
VGRRNIIGWSRENVHVDTQFTRYRKDDTPIASYESLYVVTKEQGHWAIKIDRASRRPPGLSSSDGCLTLATRCCALEELSAQLAGSAEICWRPTVS